MLNFNDIYRIQFGEDYFLGDIKEKKRLVDIALKRYIVSKINQITDKSGNFLVNLNVDDMIRQFSVVELLLILDRMLPLEKRLEPGIGEDFVYFILNIAGTLQGISIIWGAGVGEGIPEVKFGEWEQGFVCDHLITYENNRYVDVFKFFYEDVFCEVFGERNAKEKLKTQSVLEQEEK